MHSKRRVSYEIVVHTFWTSATLGAFVSLSDNNSCIVRFEFLRDSLDVTRSDGTVARNYLCDKTKL